MDIEECHRFHEDRLREEIRLVYARIEQERRDMENKFDRVLDRLRILELRFAVYLGIAVATVWILERVIK